MCVYREQCLQFAEVKLFTLQDSLQDGKPPLQQGLWRAQCLKQNRQKKAKAILKRSNLACMNLFNMKFKKKVSEK